MESKESLLFVCALMVITCLSGLYHHPLITIWDISYRTCLDECECSTTCQMIRYDRRYARCELDTGLTFSLPPQSPGLKVTFVKHGSHVGTSCSKYDTNDTCTRSDTGVNCSVEICKRLERPSDSVLKGNIFTVGSKALYTCPGLSKTFQTTCLSNREWSDKDLLKCKCTDPKRNHNANIKYLYKSNHSFEMVLSCNRGYELLQSTNAKCNILTGKWTDINMSGCYIMSNPPFRKIYSYITGAILDCWLNDKWYTNNVRSWGQFRNSSVLNNWPIYVNKRIKLEIIRDGTVVHFIMFNGTNSNKIDWFSSENILDSSWDDLTSTPAKGPVSMVGDKKKRYRFIVGQYLQGDDHCNHTGWFMISWGDYYPCDKLTGHVPQDRLLYSTSKTVARFRSSDVALADRFEFWIEE